MTNRSESRAKGPTRAVNLPGCYSAGSIGNSHPMELGLFHERDLRAAILLAILIGSGFLLSASVFRNQKSTTVDETFYLHGGLAVYWTGSFHVVNGLGAAPLPIVLSYWLPAITHEPDGRVFRSRFPMMGERGDREMVEQARLVSSVVIGLPLILGIYIWLYRRHGLGLACTGGSLMAASPLMLSHGALATTDACITLMTLLSLAAMVHYQKKPTTGSVLLLGCAVGAVVSAKYSGVFIFPVAGLVLLTANWPASQEGTPRQALVECLSNASIALPFFLAAVFLTILSANGFNGNDVLAGLQVQLTNVHRGYLMGEISTEGWLHYYPVVFAAKSSEAELALLLTLFGAGTWRMRSLDWRGRDFAFLLWTGTMALYAIGVMSSGLSNGPRYLMVLYPLLILATLDTLGLLLKDRQRWLATCCAALVATQLIASATSAPHWLAYFNRFVGGPEQGRELLISDNIDWGQDLPALRVALEDLACTNTSFIYFGSARFEDYGIEADRYRQSRGHFEDYDCLAISENNLHSLFANYPEFAGLRWLTPAGMAGHSIRIFRPGDPEVAAALSRSRDRT